MAVKYSQGTTIRLAVETRDSDGDPFDPTSVVISVTKGATTHVDGESMSNSATGQYYYNWQTEADQEKGKYDVSVTSTYAGYTAVKLIPRSFLIE